MIKTAYTQTITILYKYFYIWRLDLRLNNTIYLLLSLISAFIFIIIVIIKLLNHSLTSKSILKVQISLSQTSFSLYLHNQWTDFHMISTR